MGDGAARMLPSRGLPDTRDRMLRDLRISVTDRCTFRCTYCMPKEVFGRDYAFLDRSELLTFEEITRIARIALDLGVTKLRLTGGEPLLRRGLPDLIRLLAALRTPDGARADLALTTNGAALPRMAQTLRDAGLDRVTVSLDSLDDARFRAINDVGFPVARVLSGIDAAVQAGFDAVKVNAVITRGVNDDELLALAERFRGTGIVLRFIEFMDVGSTNGWRMEQVVPSSEVIATIGAVHPLDPLGATAPGETARRWAYRDGAGEIGVISSVTEAFCGTCTRARLSAEGSLYTCLFASRGFDLRALLRGGAGDAEVRDALAGRWRARDDRYSEVRTAHGRSGRSQKIEMSYIGG